MGRGFEFGYLVLADDVLGQGLDLVYWPPSEGALINEDSVHLHGIFLFSSPENEVKRTEG